MLKHRQRDRAANEREETTRWLLYVLLLLIYYLFLYVCVRVCVCLSH